jgi:Zn-dependent peptidase ImmA (M78 family)
LPAIVVNKNDAFPAKCFTLFHEYAHLLLRQAAICEEFSHGLGEGGVETFCNRFAASLLMPKEAIAAAGGSRETPWELASVTEVSGKLRVSRQAFALRLVQLQWAPLALYTRVAQATKASISEKREASDRFPRYHILRLHAVGSRYARLVVTALDRGYIDNAHANRMLGTKEQSLTALVEFIHGKRSG